jgi:hypothetical protein
MCEPRRGGVQKDSGAGLDGRSPFHADAFVEPQADAQGVPTDSGGAADGRETVVAAYGDGTIRWHRLEDGREVLALFPLADRRNWVAWTPEGIYAATPGAHGVLRWHVNHGWDAPAEAIPVAEIPETYRPEAIRLVLQTLDIFRAIGLADYAEMRAEVQRRTVAPGARLHVLTVGVSDYGAAATHLKLAFAAADATDVAAALLNTQTGLYAEVRPQRLSNQDATKEGILRGLATIRQAMARSEPGRDGAPRRRVLRAAAWCQCR